MERVFRKILKMSTLKMGLQMFFPVIASGAVYLAGYPLTAFIIFQFFIEIFALWILSAGYILSTGTAPGKTRKIFIFNLIFALAYRLSQNIYQVWHYVNFGDFADMEKLLWLTPVHLYATGGMIYCFWLNAKWLRQKEITSGVNINESVLMTFFRILIFPWGLWNIQPRLNKIELN